MVVARRELIERRPADVKRFLAALRRAEAFVRDHPDETALLLARVTGLSEDSARRAMERHVFRLSLDDEILESLRATARFLREQHKIASHPDWSEAVDPGWLEESVERR